VFKRKTGVSSSEKVEYESSISTRDPIYLAKEVPPGLRGRVEVKSVAVKAVTSYVERF